MGKGRFVSSNAGSRFAARAASAGVSGYERPREVTVGADGVRLAAPALTLLERMALRAGGEAAKAVAPQDPPKRLAGRPKKQAPSPVAELAAQVWDDVTNGAGVVLATPLKPSSTARGDDGALYMRGVMSAEAARLKRIARLKKEAAEAKKKGRGR